jgi:hypothetical protein
MAKAQAKKKNKAQGTADYSSGEESAKTADERKLEKFHRECKSEFLADFRHDKEWRKEKERAEDFYDGEQWSEDEKKTLEERGQAPIVINRIKPKIDAIVGMEMEISVDTKAFPKGLRDYKKAQHISVALRHVEQTSDFDTVENDAFKDLLKGGRGWYKTYPEWEDFDPVIKTVKLDNSDVVPDRYSKKADLSDAKRVHETIWMDLSDAKKLFPGYEDELDKAFLTNKTMGQALDSRRRRPDQYKDSPNEEGYYDDKDPDCQEFVDKTRKQIRVVTTQYREAYYQRMMVAPNMEVTDVTDEDAAKVDEFLSEFEGAEVFSQLRYRLHQVTFTWTCVVEDKKDIAEWDSSAQFWYTKVPGYRRGRDGVDYGLVKQMIDPQSEHNKRRSKALHMISANQIIREENAVNDPEIAREEANKVDGDIVVNPNHRFEIVRNIDMGTAQLQMLQESKAELESTGVPRELEGMTNASSGREFQLRQRSQITALRELFRNLRNARRQVGQLWIKMIQHYWTAEMALKVTDDPEAPVFILNQRPIDPNTGQPALDPTTGEPLVVNDLSAGKYDLEVDESQEYVNLESETFAQLSALALKGFPVPPEMLIEVAPVPNRDKWIEQIRQQQAAQQAAVIAAAQAKGQGAAQGAPVGLPQKGQPLVG